MTDTQHKSAAEVLKRSPVARYLQLASLFRRNIESGEWEVGAKIPTVEMLAKECGVANMTVRQALDILEGEGLIERFRAKGTFVKARPRRELWCEVQTDFNGLLLARENAQIEILSDERNVTLPKFEGLIGTPVPAYRRLHRRHSRDGTSFLLADIFIDERVCAQIPEDAYSRLTAMRLVADVPDLTIRDAQQEMTIGSADFETATMLDIPLGAAVAHVRRTAADQDGALVLLADGIYRGDMVKVNFKLR
jgi:GntR family transcriptional regulator